MDQEEEVETHESYGMVSFSRRTGNPGQLFGSSLKSHESYITLSIRRAERIFSLGHERFFGGIRGDIVEVDMSAAQFAELLTTMNVGMGVPCTISLLDNKRVERPPSADVVTQKVQAAFKKDMDKLARKSATVVKEVGELLEKKSLSQADRKSILDKVTSVMQTVREDAPFMLSQFEEASEKVVVHAKAEIDAFVTANVMEAGLKSLMDRPQSLPEAPPVPALTEGKK